MNKITAILIPALLQILFILVIVLATNGTGSFVGLGAILLGIFALPITALLNWLLVRSQQPIINKLLAIIGISSLFPAFILFLYAVTS